MKFVIKARPEDFVVEELADIPLDPSGEYAVFRLTKRGWNTVDALRSAARGAGLAFDDFAYGGKKDRHAFTRQFVSLRCGPARRQEIIKRLCAARLSDEAGYAFEYVGQMAHAMSPRLLKGNAFELVVRRLSAASILRAEERIGEVAAEGYPNYFDDQRFGSYDAVEGFLAERVLKKHFSGALKLQLTRARAGDNAGDRERKHYFSEQWGDWSACRGRAGTPYEQRVFEQLCRHPKACEALLQCIPREELTVYYSAYQSFLWNEMLRRLIVKTFPGKTAVYPGAAGDYLFPVSASAAALRELADTVIPLPGMKPLFCDKRVKELYDEVLAWRGIRQGMFNALRIRQAFFKSIPRKAAVRPERVVQRSGDDHKQVTLSFTLPRGSYATMFLKSIFL